MATTCSTWKKVSKRSGSNPWERTCGSLTASIMKWKPNEYSGVIMRNGKVVARVRSKTLKGAKSAATRKMKKRR